MSVKRPEQLVSIVIPYFNMGRYIADAVGSVLAQTHKNHEIIIVNDGSTEQESINKLKLFRDNPSVQIIHQKNKGLSAARNTGVARARGEFVSCLDADDTLEPAFIELSTKGFTSKKVGFVGVHTRLFEGRTDLWKAPQYRPALLLRMNLFHSATMFSRDAWRAVGGYDETMKQGYEDWNFWLALVEKGYVWRVVPKHLTNYRIREGSMVTKSHHIHQQLYESLVERREVVFKEYAKEFAKLEMEVSTNQDAQIRYRDELIAALQTKNEELQHSMQRLTDVLESYRRSTIFRVLRKLRIIRR